jgi:hypothetical protein
MGSLLNFASHHQCVMTHRGGRVRTYTLTKQSGNRPSPLDSRRLLLQPPIRRCDRPDGGRARRSVGQHTVQVCVPPSRFRSSVSHGVSTISSRTLVNHAG